jgi:cytochrome c biogenesis protein CcmG, thiol:disulfide interchange protein DsbE
VSARRGVRLSRSQWWALLGIGVLLAAAVLLREDAPPARPAGPDLRALRTAASLEPCPAGLGPSMPDVVLPCLGGGPDVALRAQPPGRPTLVNVWASWCAPCADEAPELVAFHDKAAGRVGVVGVLNVDVQSRGLAFSRDFGMRYPSVVDDDRVVLSAFPPGPPVTVFLDAQGRVVHTRSGAFRDLAEIEALVAAHLGVRL